MNIIKNFFNIVTIVLLLFSSYIYSQNTIQQNDINEVTDIFVYQTSVTIICTQQVPYNKFYLDSPPRIVVDIKNSTLKLNKEIIPSDSKYIKQVRVKQFKTEPEKIVRVVADLYKRQYYETQTQENNIILSLLLPKLQLQQSKKIETKSEKVSKDMKEDVEQFQVVESTSENKFEGSKQIEQPKVQQVSKQMPKSEKIILPKTPVTLECVDADIQDVLQMLAVKSGVNIIYGPDVTGKITISLRKVPFDKAFENILRISKLVYVPVSENVVRVGTPEVIEKERTLQVMYTKIFPLNYAVASDVKNHLEQILKAEGRTRGVISVDERTNSLIITESEEGLQYVEEWIKKLDTKPYQVSIEAQVIDISIDDLSELGVQWGVRNIQAQSGTNINYTAGGAAGGGVSVGDINATAREVQSNMFTAPTGVPLESAVFLFGKFTDALSISGRLAMLVTQGKAKVLSNPRVTTVNNKTATIIAGEKIPYKSAVTQTTTGVGTGVGQTVQETWQYINAGIQLTVTPTVSPDGWVTLTVKPQVDIPQISAPGVPPTVKSRQTEVTVMVKNNEPLIIGGLISDSDIDAIKKLPVLGDLPILGYLFKYKTTTKKRTELIILITPRIIEN